MHLALIRNFFQELVEFQEQQNNLQKQLHQAFVVSRCLLRVLHQQGPWRSHLQKLRKLRANRNSQDMRCAVQYDHLASYISALTVQVPLQATDETTVRSSK